MNAEFWFGCGAGALAMLVLISAGMQWFTRAPPAEALIGKPELP